MKHLDVDVYMVDYEDYSDGDKGLVECYDIWVFIFICLSIVGICVFWWWC